MTLKQWIKTPKAYVILIMVAYLLIASITAHDIKGISNGGRAVVIAVIIESIYNGLKNRKRIMPDGAVITGLIIALILGTTSSWLTLLGTIVVAIIGKHLLSYKKKPIFNPAAFGLLLSIIFFKSQQSWWGAFGDSPAWMIIFLLIGGYFITNRVNKFAQVFSFLGTTFVLLLLMGHYHVGAAADALRPPFINATLFFGFFMLTDPPTTPGKTKDQIAFGIIAAVIGAVIYGIYGGLMYLFIGLLVGNLYQLARKVLSTKTTKKTNQLRRTRTRSPAN